MRYGCHLLAPLLMLAAAANAAADTLASKCVSRLGRDERLVHDAASAKLRAGSATKSAVRAAAIALVREGRLSMRAAPKAAKAAARCLAPTASG